MRIKAIVLHFFLVCIIFTNFAYSKSLFEGCIKGFSFQPTGGQEVVTVPAFPSICGKTCDKECGVLSRKMDPKDLDSEELNPDVIQECKNRCRRGFDRPADFVYGYYVRENKGTPTAPNIKFVGPFKIGTTCKTGVLSDEPKNNINSKISIKKDGDFSVIYNSNDATGVTLCGKEFLRMEPLVKFQTSSEWFDSTLLYPTYDKTSKLCTATWDDIYLKSYSYRNLWEYRVSYESPMCNWFAKNPFYLRTYIYPKNGDEFLISYKGDYSFSYDGVENKPWDHGYAYKVMMDPDETSARKALAEKKWYQNSALQIHPPSVPAEQFWVPEKVELIGEKARVKFSGKDSSGNTVSKDLFESVGFSAGCNPKDAADYKPFGLYGCVIDEDVVYKIKDDSNCSTDLLANKNFLECKTTKKPGIPKYIFYGILADYSDSHAEFMLRHPADPNIDPRYVAIGNHAGGYEVDISHGGCPFRNGKRLEYAIFDENKVGDTYNWKDIPNDVLDGTIPLKADKDGYIYLRVKPLDPDSSLPDHIKEKYIYERYGEYEVVVSKINDSGFLNLDGPIKKVVSTVYTVLFGQNRRHMTVGYIEVPEYGIVSYIEINLPPPYNLIRIPVVGVVKVHQIPIPKEIRTSLVGKLFDNIISQNKFISAIRALVILYLTFMGAGFMLGVIQMNQRELVVRSFKLAVVFAMLSEFSWEFFSKNFFDLFIYGGVELISYVATGGLGNVLPVEPSALQSDPSLIFATFDGVFTQIFSSDVWKKIGTYMLTGLMGLFTSLMVVVALLTYAYALIKAVLIYLMSLIMIAMLIVIAPVMIPMMLFQITKQYFDTWWQMLISFTLQPVAVFACIAIFNVLIAITIYAALSATICPVCYFGIHIPSRPTICILPWYQTLVSAHAPAGYSAFSYPASMFIASLTLLILVHAMLNFVEFTSKLIGALVTGDITGRGQNLGGYTGKASGLIGSGVRGTIDKVSSAGGYVAGRMHKGGENSGAGAKSFKDSVVRTARGLKNSV